MVRKTKEEAQATRELLLDAATRLFLRQGVTPTSLGDIARDAGLTRGAVYWHFANKADLLRGIWARVCDPMREGIEAIESHTDLSPLERLRRQFAWKTRRLEEDAPLREVVSILFLRCDFSGDAEPALADFQQMREGWRLKLEETLSNAIAEAELPASTDVGRSAIALMVINDGFLFHWFSTHQSFPLSEHITAAIDTYLAGLTCPIPPATPK